jgi:predicted RNA-binding protein with TRAM domain
MERRFSRPRFGGRGYEDRFEKPVKNGETYDVEIKEVGSKGDGIARVNNFVIFVPNTQKGEKCKIKISQVNRTFAVAEKVSEATEVKEEPEEDLEEDIEEEVEEKKEEGDEGDYLED